ncbi:hypothetical protein SPV2_gp20 [Sulfolobus polyhedral virus 2]|uniref:Uncharacterized protein n=1 Tax=Sulfolobus polyhedral virus 2 TaxID=2493125 RepID=A0A3S8NFF3_9VIRU|nr:hypothetical protein KM458_gp20 [Sulfolobus polyhedral virus 2]AZI76019.1 hypothetical protein SPV2_gp20 [Sulfolobus polyhedral virus 2]
MKKQTYDYYMLRRKKKKELRQTTLDEFAKK